MRRAVFPILIAVFSLVLASCSNYLLKEEEKRQRDALSAAIIQTSQRTLKVRVLPFEYSGAKVPDVEYIQKAIPEILANYMKPMQHESVVIPFAYVTNADIVNLVMASNSMFSNYITNMRSAVTQYSLSVVQQPYSFLVTNSNLTETFDRKKGITTNVWVVTVETNYDQRPVTNSLLSNIYSTNMDFLLLSAYTNLVDREFPELTNGLSFVPMELSFEPGLTNDTNARIPDTNGAAIWGTYTAIQKKNGPNEIQVTVTVRKFIHGSGMKELKLTLSSREDLLNDRLYDLLKAVRKFILDRPTGDLAVLTEPSDANVYLDGIYIGKSPLYYPAVLTGSHHMTFLKQGFAQATIETVVVPDKTNVILKTVARMKTGGFVTIESEPTNANVFVESVFVGNTPMVLSNVTLNSDHRVKILAQDTNLPAYYHTFRIRDEEEKYRINARIVGDDPGQNLVRQILFWSSVGSWGAVLGLVGLNIYTHYMSDYYLDLFLIRGNQSDYYYHTQYFSLNETSFTFFIIGSGVAFGFTALSLYNNEVYLGLDCQPGQSASASIAFRF